MAQENNYLVTGSYNGEKVNVEVSAYSPKQAKLKAGFSLGLSGKDIGEFTRSNKIRAVRR
jgi:hypothetical protein